LTDLSEEDADWLLRQIGAQTFTPTGWNSRSAGMRRAAAKQLLRELSDDQLGELDDSLYDSQDPQEEEAPVSNGSVHTTQELVEMAAQNAPIFVVHGRDHGSLHHVVRVLQNSTGRQIVVLHEQPNAGRTILEKFEEHAAVAACAVVLLTADDEGGLAGGTTRARARQNVIFELGFFFAQLGRKRVAVLVSQGVEKPSDIDGLVYIDLDSGGAWKHALVKELEAAGISVNYARIP
jgi:predicted nucleotide-binding protein